MDYNDIKAGFQKRRISFIYVFYWLMLAYIIAALVFWFIALDEQNNQITRFKIEQLRTASPDYQVKLEKIRLEQKRKSFQYAGEGITFFILIIAGAILVFRMLRKQLRLSKQQKDFMTAITHELKTPVAVTKLNLETLQKRQLDPSQQQQLIRASISETDRLNAICNNMLLLNEMDSMGYAMTREDILLNELISECVNEHRSRAMEREFVLDIAGELHINGDRMLLKLALNNLLDNAIKYSPKNSKISVVASEDPAAVFIKVIDEGEGISAQEVNLIFEKFYRGSARQTKGTGLGLYVTKQIIGLSKGTLKVTHNHPKGSIFTISFAKQ